MLARLEMAKLSEHLGKPPWTFISNSAYDAAPAPDVSVVITLYNYADYIDECLNSVCASEVTSLPNGFEILVIDDCSADRSVRLVEAFMSRSNIPIKLVKKVFNTGLASSRNAGLQLARAPYIFILDADNWIYPNCLATLYAAIAHSSYAGVYSIINRFDSKTGKSIGTMSAAEWDVSNLVGSPYIDAMAMLDRERILNVNGYSTELMEIGWSGWEDYDLWLKVAQAGDSCKFVPATLSAYRVHPQSMINTTNHYKLTIAQYFTKKFSDLLKDYGKYGIAFGFSNHALFGTELENYSDLEQKLKAMESSKFWKLRKAYFKLKRSTGLSAIDPLSAPFPPDSFHMKERIKTMESSKFWQLRNNWVKVKQTFGLADDGE